LAKLPDAEGKEKLKQSQRAWLAFRDAEAAFAADQARGGVDGSDDPLRNQNGTHSRADQTAKGEIQGLRSPYGLALRRMETLRTYTLVAFGCCIVLLWPVLAGEEIKYPSPDGRFALRITQSKDDEYHPTVDLIEKGSGKVFVTLQSASDTDLVDASESVLVWSADSKSVAYGFRASPPGARILSLGALVCFWNGSGFEGVFAGEPTSAGHQISQGKRRERETLRRRGKAIALVKVRGFGDVQRGHDAVTR
jgi:hypothetical protein